MERSKTLSFLVTSDTHKEIRKLAAERRSSVRALVLVALKQSYKELEPCLKNEKGRF